MEVLLPRISSLSCSMFSCVYVIADSNTHCVHPVMFVKKCRTLPMILTYLCSNFSQGLIADSLRKYALCCNQSLVTLPKYS